MIPETIPITDSALHSRILSGLEAVAELERRFRQPLERWLVGMCDRSDGRSREKAVEIAAQVIADCFVKRPSLLERWRGGGSLEAFLRTVAANDLRSWWKSAEYVRTSQGLESPGCENAAAVAEEPDPGNAEVALEALRAGAEATERHCAEGLVFMRLKGLFRVEQRAISRCWALHESQVSRRIKEAMTVFREAALDYARSRGCELTPELMQQALQRHPAVLLGGAPAENHPGGDEASLRRLAEGGAGAAERELVVMQLCRDARALSFFARLLNRNAAEEPVVVKPPGMPGWGAQLQACLRRSLEVMRPVEAGRLVDEAMRALFSALLAGVQADGGALWLLSPGEPVLEAVFDPVRPQFAGQRQPLVSGIISLVLATGEPVCTGAAASEHRHSPAIDEALGQTTRSMIAVPFAPGGTVRGVLTTVRFGNPTPFHSEDMAAVLLHAVVLARLFQENLTHLILEE